MQNDLAARHHGDVTELVASLSTTPGRGRPRSTAADLAIVHATIEILLQDGYDGLTMAGVAQRAGVSTATLYRRYESKIDLVVGCITTLKDEFHEPVDTGSLTALDVCSYELEYMLGAPAKGMTELRRLARESAARHSPSLPSAAVRVPSDLVR